MARFSLAGAAAVFLLLLAGCGGPKNYTKAATQTCLTQRGVKIGGTLDFVAGTATGGAFVAQLGDNHVTVAFGQNVKDGEQLEDAYQRFAFKNVRAGLADVLQRYNDVVTLWHAHPSDSDVSLIQGCLR